jgi:hypothetical protein
MALLLAARGARHWPLAIGHWPLALVGQVDQADQVVLILY